MYLVPEKTQGYETERARFLKAPAGHLIKRVLWGCLVPRVALHVTSCHSVRGKLRAGLNGRAARI